MKNQELEVSEADPCLFIKHEADKKLFVVIQVDDGLVIETNKIEVEEFMNQLSQSFQTARGSLNQFWGMNVTRLDDDGSVFVNQCVDAKKILSRFHLDYMLIQYQFQVTRVLFLMTQKIN